jgi:TPR repeat protein
VKIFFLFFVSLFFILNPQNSSANDEYKNDEDKKMEDCDSGNASICKQLAEENEMDHEKYILFMDKSCKAKDGESCNHLAIMHLTVGVFVDGKIYKDPEKAIYYLNKSCDLNNSDGCLMLGSILESGTVIEQDYKKSFDLFKKSCDLGNHSACGALGMSYFYGRGVKQDHKKAKSILKKSCESGSMKSCENLKKINY